MEVVDVLRAFGGNARWKQLTGKMSRRVLQRAVDEGVVEHRGNVYCLPPPDRAREVAREMRGIRSHRSAAIHWGFALPPVARGEPEQHDIAIPPKAQRKHVPADVHLRYPVLDESDITDEVLTPLAAVAFCLRDLSLRDALSVGDSALASGLTTMAQIEERVARFRGPRRALALRRLTLLNANSANAFESSCRALLIEAGIEGFEPQVQIRHRSRWIGRFDLVHRRLRIVIECDGFEHHGTLDAMTRDCIRHTRLAAAGWRTLRFTWYQVMHRPDWVLDHVRDTIAAASLPCACADRGSTVGG